MKRFMIGLLICIPLASVVLGIAMIYLAIANPDAEVIPSEKPLSKTSWREAQ